MVTFKFSIAYGRVVSRVTKIFDNQFTMFRDQPKVFSVGNHQYVVLTHPKVDQVLLEYTIATLCIEVEGEMLRYYLFRSHLCPCHRYYPRNYLPPFNTGVSLSATIKTGTI